MNGQCAKKLRNFCRAKSILFRFTEEEYKEEYAYQKKNWKKLKKLKNIPSHSEYLKRCKKKTAK